MITSRQPLCPEESQGAVAAALPAGSCAPPISGGKGIPGPHRLIFLSPQGALQAIVLPEGSPSVEQAQDTLETLLIWVADMEDLVGNQKPPSSEVKVVKAQLQEQKVSEPLGSLPPSPGFPPQPPPWAVGAGEGGALGRGWLCLLGPGGSCQDKASLLWVAEHGHACTQGAARSLGGDVSLGRA